MESKDDYFTKIKNVLIIGACITGVSTGALIANKCPDLKIRIVDASVKRIHRWNSLKQSFRDSFEPRFKENVEKSEKVNLEISLDMVKSIEEADLIFISVNTPPKTVNLYLKRPIFITDGTYDMKYLEKVAKIINSTSKSSKIVVETTKIGQDANELLRRNLVNNKNIKYAILSNPLHICDDNSILINGILDTQQIFIYSENNPWNQEAIRKLKGIYLHWVSNESIFTTKSEFNLQIKRLLKSAIEYQKISNYNSVQSMINTENFLDIYAQDIKKDINSKLAYNHLKLDTQNLIYLCKLLDLKHVSNYWSNIVSLNYYQEERLIQHLDKIFKDWKSNLTITIYGSLLELKDENSHLELKVLRKFCKALLKRGFQLLIRDSVGSRDWILFHLSNDEFDLSIETVNKNIQIHEDPKQLFFQSNAIILCNTSYFKNWKFYKTIKGLMNTLYIFDLCENSIIDKKELESFGFIIEAGLIDYKLIRKLYLDSNLLNPQISLNETALLNEYLCNENAIIQTISNVQANIIELTISNSLIQEISSIDGSCIPMITENSNLTIKSTREVGEMDNKKFIDHLNTFDLIFDFEMEKIQSKAKFRFLAQILNIFDMELKLFCTQCSLIFNMCKCLSKINSRIDFQAKFLIDDHTGQIKVNYKNENLNLNDKQFALFGGISSFLFDLLKIFGNLRVDSIPICRSYNQKSSFSEIISCKLLNGNLSKNEIEFMKVVHDFLYQTFLYKYYQVEVPNTSLISKKLNKDNIFILKENSQQYKDNEKDKDMKNTILVDCINIESLNTIFHL